MKPLTLYELNSLVRDALTDALPGRYWVQGELSEARAGQGGHFYGELVQRDKQRDIPLAKARITCWAGAYQSLEWRFRKATGESLRAGLNVLLEVEVTFHVQYGYSLNVTDIDPSFTLGEMAMRKKAILAQLETDGILHDNQTLPMPLVVQRIAVVSSASAAGYGDFYDQLRGNEYGFHFHIKLFPALMQGNRVEESVISALEQIAAEFENWDAVVIIRGGGATSDLNDFDSYPLAACVAQMPLPVITGIGHERDETVLDYVANVHLKTPTAVASFLIDRMAQIAANIDELTHRIVQSVTQRLACEKERMARLSVVLPMLFRNMRERQERRLDILIQGLISSQRERLQRECHRLELMEQRLHGLDPTLLLKRGYSMTFASDGRLLRDTKDVASGETIRTRLANGEVKSVIVNS